MEIRDQLVSETCTVFVDRDTGFRFMQDLGYEPDPALMHVPGEDETVLHGYEVPASDVEACLELAREAGVPFEVPGTPSLALVPFTGSEIERQDLQLQASLSACEARLMARTVGAFLDVAGTSTARASFYNTREEQAAAEARIHGAVFEIDRGLYGALMTLPGTMDHTRQLGVLRLLSHPRAEDVAAVLDVRQESDLLRWLLSELSPPRMLKLFGMLRAARVNNARTRKLILRTILGSRNLELWSTRYRRKLRSALEHALGKRTTGIVRSILVRPHSEWTEKEKDLLNQRLGRYARVSDLARVYECIAFILGRETLLTLPLLQAYRDAKRELSAGRRLSYETLEGLRSTFHKERTSAEVLELTRGQLTRGQQMTLQRKSEEAGVKVELDLSKYDAVRLYLYGFERGMNDEIAAALDRKAALAAEGFPTRFGGAGILVDASASMAGHATQALRPIAVALATRDMLRAASEHATVLYCSGEAQVSGDRRLVRPCGDTSLAEGLVALLEKGVDVVFVLSDGYENAPAGRLAEVAERVRALGIDTPIYQLSPVFAAEAEGLRPLCRGLVAAMPVTRPEAMSLALLKGMLRTEPFKAVSCLLQLALPKIVPARQLSAEAMDRFVGAVRERPGFRPGDVRPFDRAVREPPLPTWSACQRDQ